MWQAFFFCFEEYHKLILSISIWRVRLIKALHAYSSLLQQLTSLKLLLNEFFGSKVKDAVKPSKVKDAVTGVFEKISYSDHFYNNIPTTGDALLFLSCSVFITWDARSNKNCWNYVVLLCLPLAVRNFGELVLQCSECQCNYLLTPFSFVVAYGDDRVCRTNTHCILSMSSGYL